jgi:putative thioredoxin
MNELPSIIDITADDFAASVLERSRAVPVLVDFWASWCGPCKMLMPLLEKLAGEYQGQFLLAKANIDEQQELAAHYGVQSVPTVKVFRHGEVVDEFLGVQSEAAIRAIIDRYVERRSDRAFAEAQAAYARGEVEEALEAGRAAADSDPQNHRLAIALAEMLLEQDRLDEAEARLRALPADIGAEEAVGMLLARLEFARVAYDAPAAEELASSVAANPDDSEARYRLGCRRVVAGDYEGAMEQFLELMRRNRSYGDDAARKALLKVFDILGGGELVQRYRTRMARLLY